jgi:hypothetical protein
MSVAKRLIEEQLEENARQEEPDREFIDGAFYWVRDEDDIAADQWSVALYSTAYDGPANPWYWHSGYWPTSHFIVIGPLIGKEPAEKTRRDRRSKILRAYAERYVSGKRKVPNLAQLARDLGFTSHSVRKAVFRSGLKHVFGEDGKCSRCGGDSWRINRRRCRSEPSCRGLTPALLSTIGVEPEATPPAPLSSRDSTGS